MAHKQHALEVLINNYSFVITHFEESVADARKDIKQSDKAKIRGWKKQMLEYR